MTADPLAPLLDLPGVADGVAAGRSAVDALLNNRVLRQRSPDVSAESSLRGAWIAATLAGAPAGLDEVRSGAAAADPVVQGALRAYAAIGSLTDTWTRAPRQALARLHVLAAADLVADADQLGRPVPGAAERLDTLATVLARTEAPAAVVAAIVHGEIAGPAAFGPASTVVALAAARLTVIERGLDLKSLVVLEAGHRDPADDSAADSAAGEPGAGYAAALAAYREGTPEGVARWLTHCAAAVVTGARETTAICEALARG